MCAGECPADGYGAAGALAGGDGRVVGLALDESDPGGNGKRLEEWCRQLENLGER